jgi:Protein of unknown function (DUF1615)
VRLEFLGRVLVKVIKISLPWLFVILVIVLATWQLPNVKQPLGGAPKSDRENLLMPGLSVKQIAHLIELVAPNVNNSVQWAIDLKSVLKIQHLESSHEDICAMIAIINQESSFEENPHIAGISEQALHSLSAKLVAITPLGHRNVSSIETWLKHKPSIKNSYWHRLRTAKTQHAVDLTYREIIADKLFSRGKLGSVLQIDPSLRDSIEDNNAIKTIGPMQVAVSFAVQIEEQSLQRALALDEIWAIRDRMYTREGGMGYGAVLLLGYDGGYDKKLYRFADFNAGRYASRNAGFQTTIAGLLNKPLATDGDLLMYDKQGKPSAIVSNSERAINELAEKYHLALSAAQVRADLLQEKHGNFHRTVTYTTITQHYQKLMQKPAPFAVVPNIVLHSDKATRTMSTEKFTDKVNTHYQRCLKKQ